MDNHDRDSPGAFNSAVGGKNDNRGLNHQAVTGAQNAWYQKWPKGIRVKRKPQSSSLPVASEPGAHWEYEKPAVPVAPKPSYEADYAPAISRGNIGRRPANENPHVSQLREPASFELPATQTDYTSDLPLNIGDNLAHEDPHASLSQKPASLGSTEENPSTFLQDDDNEEPVEDSNEHTVNTVRETSFIRHPKYIVDELM